MTNRFFLLCVLVSCCCCTDKGTEPDVSRMYQLWQSHALHDYTFDQRRDCFCPLAGEVMRIVVRSDTVFSVTRLSDGAVLPAESVSYYLTIDSLFGLIHNSTADSLVITYNSRYGYPEVLDIDPQLHPVDGGVLYSTSNLQIP